MLPTRPSRVVVVALAVVAIACGDPTKPRATYANALSSYALYAFTGAPVNAATAISFLGGAARADASFAFDVAFDLDATGRPVVYPVAAIASDLAGGVKRVGLQVIPGPFEAVREVPEKGYDTLSVRTINVRDVLAVELLDLSTCRFSLGGQTIYAMLTVDSVNATTRRLYARAVVDPNCGYRSVVPDSIPER
ncbi:MAG TPA: hypothetical protein VM033_04110 [Gemmatimonadaceae bacterium]|nr:hypothetical protein [Gemmatimonadaceae bacterium]